MSASCLDRSLVRPRLVETYLSHEKSMKAYAFSVDEITLIMLNFELLLN